MNTPMVQTAYELILSEIDRILGDAPAFGSAGVTIHFHEGRVVRVTTSREVSVKPAGAGR